MKLSEFKASLAKVQETKFLLPDGTYVPAHFHITELGISNKHFIDCGGTVRTETKINLQIWEANDFEHRLKPSKLLDIIAKAEDVLNVEDAPVEVEYQKETIGKYSLSFNGVDFMLMPTYTDCLAKDTCGDAVKPKVKLSNINIEACAPGSGCC